MPIQIVKPGTNIDFLSRWRFFACLSVGILLLGAAAIPLRGFRLGIDFAGGNEVQIRFEQTAPVDEGQIRAVVNDVGIDNASVIRYGVGDTNEFLIKFKGERAPRAIGAEVAAGPEGATGTTGAEPGAGGGAEAGTVEAATVGEGVRDLIEALTAALGKAIGPLEVERVEFVGPKVGAELRRDGLAALGLACLLILAYIAFRFSTRFAPGAVVALVHDVLVTSSIWILLGLEFDLKVLAALLAIIGYSLNDTIIVYDRIRENMELRTKRNLMDVLNLSINQTLSRTLLTSLSTLVAVLSLLLLGGDVIRPFALAMTIGIFVGTYSSVYVAGPVLMALEHQLGSVVPAKGKGKGKPAHA